MSFISKETIQRLVKDVKNIINNPLFDNGIYYIHDDTDILKGYALIIGPSDTPYFAGNYFFEFNFPYDYPYSPPNLTYWTNADKIRLHPNFNTCGKICISILNTWRGDQWTSCQTISSVLLTLCSLLSKNPLLNEPLLNESNNKNQNNEIHIYNEIIEYSNINIAVFYIINKQKNVFMPFFELFNLFIEENFLKNYNQIMIFLEKKNVEFNYQAKIFYNYCYNMTVSVDYNKLIKKIKSLKEKLN